ncbi:MAG: mechanosensitive ion channel family protein [Mycobacteriales bacterium]
MVRPDLRLAAVIAVAAIGFLVVGGFGSVHARELHQRILAWVGAAGFAVTGALAVRRTADQFYRALSGRTGRSHAEVVRLLATIAGFAIVLFTTLGLLAVPVQHLLLGGALTGIIIGIAAQQALGNLFAGLVLLLARPFNVGDDIVVRAGSLGGIFNATVTGMGMTYVTLETDQGPLSVPNSVLLAAGIGPAPPPSERTGAT